MNDTPHPLSNRLIDSIADYAIFAVDTGGTIITWNTGAERITGYGARQIVGTHVSRLYDEAETAAGEPARHLALARDDRVEDHGWRVRRDGTRFPAHVVVTPIRDDRRSLIGFATVIRDSTEHMIEKALHSSEMTFELLVQSVEDYAILMLDPKGRVLSWNAGAARIKGYKASEILGRSFTVFYPEEALAVGFPQHELDAAVRFGRFEDESWRLRKDGSRFWANVVITALRDENGSLVGFAKVTRDLTARVEMEHQARRLAAEKAAHAEALRRSADLEEMNEELQMQAAELEAQAAELEEQKEEASALAEQLLEANDELQHAVARTEAARQEAERSAIAMAEAYRELDQFAYVASHDLKAPLRGIANLAQWIQDDLGDDISEQSAKHLGLLQGRVHRMEALIEGILTYSRAGRALGKAQRIETGTLVGEIIELIAPPPGVTIDVAKDMPVIDAERVPLEQVFMNLIANAVKFAGADRDRAHVTVGWLDAGEDFEFTVHDDGPGIAPEFHERIWGIFQTLAPRDRVEGTGIGLSVVKKVIETRGGRVSVESVPGHGATFRFTWPKRLQERF